MKYKPWKGFSLIALGVAMEFLVQGEFHRTGIFFLTTLFAASIWSSHD